MTLNTEKHKLNYKKIVKAKEIREKSKEEIGKFLGEKRALARELRFDIASKQTKDHRECREAKKDVAKLLTVLNEKKILKSSNKNFQ